MRPCIFTVVLACLSAFPAVAFGTGTARIQQRDGSVKTYQNVRISIENKQMSITSADRAGTLVIGKAACSSVGKLVQCLPYSATLKQHGATRSIAIQSGSAWFNPGDVGEQLPLSSTQLPPRGVLVSIRTKSGTYFSLSGVVDDLKK